MLTVKRIHISSFLTGLLILVTMVLMTAATGLAAYDVNISADASANGSWSGTAPAVWTPTGSGSNISVAELRTKLASGAASISTAGTGSEPGNINVNAAITWSANNLTMTADNDIRINAVMSATSSSSLTMNYGTSGAVRIGFAPGEAQVFVGRVDFPGRSGNGFLTINGAGYTVINTLGNQDSSSGLDLQGMRGNLAGKYALGANINAFVTAGWNVVAGFQPIGDNSTTSDATRFTGVFDGLGHTISNLFINRPTTKYVGLFGYGSTSIIRNLGISDSDITGDESVGTVVGNNYPGFINNCYSSGTVRGTNYVGGLIGENLATVTDSNTNTTVIGNNFVGGLAGSNLTLFADVGSISRSFAKGSVSGTSTVGGLVGTNFWGKVLNSYATGNVVGSSNTGGLFGENVFDFDPFFSDLTNSYATGNVNLGISSPTAGGLIGNNESSVTNSFWDTQTSGQSVSGGVNGAGSGKTTAEMRRAATFSGWDISASDISTSIWRISEGITYPQLRTFVPPLSTAVTGSATAITTSSATLNGTVTAKYDDATVSFEYGPDTNYGNTVSAVPATAIVGNGDTVVSADLSSLTPGQTYHYRVVATNSAGTSYGNEATFTVNKLTATVTLGDLDQTFDNSQKFASATTNPPGKAVTFTYNGSALAPTNAGSYAVVGTINDANYQGSASGTLVIGKATATITLGSLSQIYDGTGKITTATTNPIGKSVTFTYDGSSTLPVNTGSYTVAATIVDDNYQGSASGTLVIGKATATVTFGNLVFNYDGTSKSASAITNPAGKNVTITYDGSAEAPVNIGSYAVVGTISDINYQGSASGTLVINPPTLAVSVTANGTQPTGIGGTVTSTPAGISCANNVGGTAVTCSGSFSGTVSLYATPSALSRFGGWGGACTGLGACNVTMSGDKIVTATFNQATLLHIDGSTYPTLQAAYNAASDGSVIQMLDGSVTGTLSAVRNLTVTLKGGYDTGYNANIGTTAVTAPLTIEMGSIVADRIVIK